MEKFIDEIRTIRKMINETTYKTCNNFAKKRTDEELQDCVTYLKSDSTGLSCDIIVDCGETYKYFNHPLCLYIVNGEDVFPVLIAEQPSAPRGEKIPMDVIVFIQQNLQALRDLANLEISGDEFFDLIDKNQLSLVGEMSILSPDKTGLDIFVYVDDTGSFNTSGHNGSYRIKFQQDKDIKNPRMWMPITIPGLKVMDKGKLPSCKEPQRDINLVIKWAQLNMELLLQLRDGFIDGKTFRKTMQKLTNVEIILKSETIK